MNFTYHESARNNRPKSPVEQSSGKNHVRLARLSVLAPIPALSGVVQQRAFSGVITRREHLPREHLLQRRHHLEIWS